MDNSLVTFDDDMYENMSYDERRNFNLARNREMMNLLFAGGNPLRPDEDDDKETQSTPSKCVDLVPNEPDAETLMVEITSKEKIFCRDKETLHILQYLDKNLFPTQPLIVHGPQATG